MRHIFYGKIEEIVKKDSRYKSDAYEFLMRALWFTQNKLKKEGHISGRDLVLGIRDFILEQYGPMAKVVLHHWGIKKTDDFGDIVFNMVESGLLRKTDEDSRDDFKNVYDFDQELDVFKENAVDKLNPQPKPRSVAKKVKAPAAKVTTAQKKLGGASLN